MKWEWIGKISLFLLVITILTTLHHQEYFKVNFHQEKINNSHIISKDIMIDLKPIKILIIALPRSGSSLTGKILSADPETFYNFEPFHKEKFTYPNGSKLTSGLEFTQVNQSFISNYTNGLFECRRYVSNLR